MKKIIEWVKKDWEGLIMSVYIAILLCVGGLYLHDYLVVKVKEGDYKFKEKVSVWETFTDINSITPKDKKDLSFLVPVDGAVEDVYYITEYGEKYHKRKCRYLSFEPHEITLDYAREHGYTGCKVCIDKDIRDGD